VYFNDSVGQKTWAYDFDLEIGSISNRRVLVDFVGSEGEPDGLVIELASPRSIILVKMLSETVRMEISGWQFMDQVELVSSQRLPSSIYEQII